MCGANAWLGSDNPSELIQYARTSPGPCLDRALRFFAIHCCRLITPALKHPPSRAVIDVAERHLLGLASGDEFTAALLDANTAAAAARGEWELYAHDPATRTDHGGRAERMSNSLGAHVAATAARIGYYDGMLAHVRDALAFRGLLRGAVGGAAFRADLCRILREVVANPFREVTFAPEWRTETAVLLARRMLATNDFGAMPILADALQDAGCDADDVLNHCRDTSQVHLRGCWVLELVLSSA